jgi:hypothetical protein
MLLLSDNEQKSVRGTQTDTIPSLFAFQQHVSIPATVTIARNRDLSFSDELHPIQ